MKKRNMIILILVITIIVGILGYLQVQPIFMQRPSNNFIPITINEAKPIQDNNMTLSFLYNITKEKHPTGTKEIYCVRDYIANCLEEMNVPYDIQSRNLDETFVRELLNEKRNELIKIKNNYYNELKNQIGNKDVEQFIKENTEYSSFDEMYQQEHTQGKDTETMMAMLEESYNKKIKKYKNATLNNIIVKLNSGYDLNAQNLLLVAHYDSAEESYGAGDDGMPVAGLLETIRCLKNKSFKNNIYILFTDGEEQEFLGAIDFIIQNHVNFDLVINFDNSGNSGNLFLYHYSNDNLTRQYFKSNKREVSYSFVNELLFNQNSEYFQYETSDAFMFVKKGYNTLDLALACNPFYYHSEKDNFYNIDVDALYNMTKSMIEMVEYYGNNKIEKGNNDEIFNLKLINGVELSISKIAYIVISVAFICISFIYVILLFIKKEKILKKSSVIILSIVSILTLILFKNLSLLFSIPCIILFISDKIKNDRGKNIFTIFAFEIYLFVIIQMIVPIVQYVLWLLNSLNLSGN